jgi:hypothetical protein
MDDVVLTLERNGIVAAGGASLRTAGPVLRSADPGDGALSEAA